MKIRDREYLRTTLKHTGLSYREIAELAGVSHAVIANLAREGGRDGCSEKSAHGISAACKVDTALLFLSAPYSTDVQTPDERRTLQGLRKGESE